MNGLDIKDRNAIIFSALQLRNNGHAGRAEFELAQLLLRCPADAYVLAALSEFYYLERHLRQSVLYAKASAALITPDSAMAARLYASKMLSSVGDDAAANAIALQAMAHVEGDCLEMEHLACHLSQLGLLDEALTLFRTIGNSALSDVAMASRAMAMLYASDIDASKVQFSEALARNPGNALAAWQLAMLDVPEGRERRIAGIESRLSVVQAGDDGVLLRLAMFNECDLAGDTARAFRSLQEANDLVGRSVRYDVKLESSLVDDYMTQLQSLDFCHEPTIGSDVPIPVFIIGLPRTGTTLLEKSICLLGDVQAVGEHLCFRKGIERQLGNVFGSPFEIANRDFAQVLDFNALGRSYRDNSRWRAANRAFYTDKEPFNYAYAGLIAKALPGARIIHIRRNPMDACFSAFKQMFGRGIYPASYAMGALVGYYRNYERVMAFWREQLGERMLEIRYEDLVLRHEETLARIKAYCRFGDAVQVAGTPRPYKASTLSAAQVQKPIHAGNINAWAKYREYLKPLRTALDAEYTAYMRGIDGVEIL